MSDVRVLQELNPSRRRLTDGDIFVMQLPDDRYVYGRVIRGDIPDDEGPMPRTSLIYIYRDPQPTKSPALKLLSVDRLLGPPRFINRLPWSRATSRPYSTFLSPLTTYSNNTASAPYDRILPTSTRKDDHWRHAPSPWPMGACRLRGH